MEDMLIRRAYFGAIGVMCALLVCSCARQPYKIPKSFPAASQAEAGTLLVSPVMVAPWDEVATSLKPAFALTGDQAASQVLPTTESISEQVLHSFGASLAAGLPTSATTSKTTIGGDNPGTTITTEKAPGTPPTLTNTLPSSASLPAGSVTSGALGLDPGLKYEAANYLLQKVQLLNQQIDNAAARSCFVPYVVKLKLAIMNYRPRLPYSVHSHIAFHYNGAAKSETRDAVNYPGALTQASKELAPECDQFGVNPAVIPFLAADDLQMALHSRAAEAASQIAVGLSALVHGVGLSANANALNQSLIAISNHDLTSSLTVGRESESSLYVLITPNNQASNLAALTSQTYDVAVLVLIPRYYFGGAFDPQSPTFSVASFSEYRDANSGAVLGDGGRAMFLQQGSRIVLPHLTPDGMAKWITLSDDEKYTEMKGLAKAIEQGSMVGMMNRLQCVSSPSSKVADSLFCAIKKPAFVTDYPVELWADFASLLDYDNGKLAIFEARLPTPVGVPSQQVVLNDDGTKPIQVLLGGVSGRSVAKVTAFLNVTPFDVNAWERRPTLKIPAQTLTFDSTAHTLSATFPSLKKLNITCLSPASIPPKPLPPKPDPKAKPAPDGAAKPKPPDCPQDSQNSAADQPNRVQLALTGCDARREVCPLLTDTVLDEADYMAGKSIDLARWERWVSKDVDAKAPGAEKRLADLKRLSAEWTAARVARALWIEKPNEVTGKKPSAANESPNASRRADKPTLMQAYYWQRSQAYSEAATLGLERYLGEPATLSVYLAAPPSTPDAATVTFSNFGPAIDIEKGVGQMVFTIAATPATDAIAISVKGASIKTITDNTETEIALSAKHGFVLPQAGVYTLNLTDMKEKTPVVVSAQALKGDSNDGDAVTRSFDTVGSTPKPAASTPKKPNAKP